MHYCTMALITGYGVKADVAIEMLFRTQWGKFSVNAHLCLLSRLYSGEKPAQELNHCNAIPPHGIAETAYLSGILHGFHDSYRWRYINDRNFCAVEKREASGATAHKYAVILISLQCRRHVFVGQHLYFVCMEIHPNFCSQFSLVDKQCGFILMYEQITDKDGVAVYVLSAEIERPCYLVECSDEHTVSMVAAYRFSNTGQFRLYAFPCVFLLLYLYWRKRNLWAVFPYRAEWVEICPYRYPRCRTKVSD